MKNKKIIVYVSRIYALLVLAIMLPFYLGYGNPIPFTNPEYTLSDNVWLITFPISFVCLICGIKWPKISGYIILGIVSIGFVIDAISSSGFAWPMMFVLIAGAIYIISEMYSRQ